MCKYVCPIFFPSNFEFHVDALTITCLNMLLINLRFRAFHVFHVFHYQSEFYINYMLGFWTSKTLLWYCNLMGYVLHLHVRYLVRILIVISPLVPTCQILNANLAFVYFRLGLVATIKVCSCFNIDVFDCVKFRHDSCWFWIEKYGS